MNSGRWAIVALLVTAVAMAGFAVWFRQQAGRQCREAWGVAHAQRIQHAVGAELWQLEPSGDPGGEGGEPSGDLIQVDDDAFRVVSRRDLAGVTGATHIRAALIEDRSFRWDGAAPCADAWTYALHFADSSGQTTLLIDLECSRIRRIDGQREVRFDPIRKFLTRFITDQRDGGTAAIRSPGYTAPHSGAH